MEFVIKIISYSNNVSHEEFNKSWKLISKQSERQLGAYIFIYLKEFGVKPEMLKQKSIELRNKVIHKGYFPNYDECVNFGNDILNFIRPTIEKLKSAEKFDYHLVRSINESESHRENYPKFIYITHQTFAINRPFNEVDTLGIEQMVLKIKNP